MLKNDSFHPFAQELFDDISGSDLDAEVTDRQLEYLRKARDDASVRMDLLEPAYVKFVRQHSPSAIACILSIL
jgi:hypothetical protein